jgi:hypothetical protein
LNGSSIPGQIVVDTNNPSWLKYNGGGPFFMAGPGDPEGFLYRGSRNSDGTRKGDQMELIEKLKGTGANCIYLMAVRSHGGDGDATQNPFINSNPPNGLDHDILDQWESWFNEMDRNGIVIFFIFYDDSAQIWDTGDTVGQDEKAFIEAIVDRFKHHRSLIWCVAEEYQERFSSKRIKSIASIISSADNHDHVIAVHKLSGLNFSEFANEANIDQFAIQYNVRNVEQLHAGMLTAWNYARGRYNLIMSETKDHGTGRAARLKNWAVAMGGAYVMALGWDIANTPKSTLEDCGRLVSFMESTNFNEMAPHDELGFKGTQYVLAAPGESYIAYASNLSGEIGLINMAAGKYDFKWYDVKTGKSVIQNNIAVEDGANRWSKPNSIGREMAVYIKRIAPADKAASIY